MIKEKACSKCKVVKHIFAFHKDKSKKSGRRTACRECCNKQNAVYREKNRETINTKSRLHARKPEIKEMHKKYREANRHVAIKSSAKYVKKNPLKRAAHKAVWHAVKSGRLKKKPCEVCGEKRADAHHDDYTKKLKVRWLCRPHHIEHHKNLRKVKE